MVVSLVWCGVVQRGSSNWCAGRRAGSHVNLSRLKCICSAETGSWVGDHTLKTVPVVCFYETHKGRGWITDKEPNGQKPIAN
jgi:hypothetical protein